MALLVRRRDICSSQPWCFNIGVTVAFMGALAYIVRVYARLVELGAETSAKNPYVAEMYKLALEGKLYSRSIP